MFGKNGSTGYLNSKRYFVGVTPGVHLNKMRGRVHLWAFDKRTWVVRKISRCINGFFTVLRGLRNWFSDLNVLRPQNLSLEELAFMDMQVFYYLRDHLN